MDALHLCALMAIVFLVIFVAANVRRTGWFSIIAGLIGIILILLIASNGPAISTLSDHVFHFQSVKSMAPAAHIVMPGSKQSAVAATAHHLSSVRQAGDQMVVPQMVAKITSVHQSAPVQMTMQNTLVPILLATFIGLLSGVVILILLFVAIRRVNHRRGVTLLAPSLSTSRKLSPAPAQAEQVLTQYHWRTHRPAQL